jgi:hypothetical protein
VRPEDIPTPAQRFKHPLGLRVHALLWNEWDPIGVRTYGTDDEYDGYVWPLIGKVMQAETVEQIADYLEWAMTEHMGLSADPADLRRAHLLLAQQLVTLKSGVI